MLTTKVLGSCVNPVLYSPDGNALFHVYAQLLQRFQGQSLKALVNSAA